MKRIPEKIFTEWHSTGKDEHKFVLGVSDDAKYICRVCSVRTGGDPFGCQGMAWNVWLKKNHPKYASKKEKN